MKPNNQNKQDNKQRQYRKERKIFHLILDLEVFIYQNNKEETDKVLKELSYLINPQQANLLKTKLLTLKTAKEDYSSFCQTLEKHN